MPSEANPVEDMVSQPLGPTAMPSFILHYFDFRIDHYRFLASYHHHLRICPRIYVHSSHTRYVLGACRHLFPTNPHVHRLPIVQLEQLASPNSTTDYV